MIGALLPRPVFEIALVLFLSFLVGIEREEHKATARHYVFGGARTFPLIGFVGYGVAHASGGNVVALGAGLLAVAGLLAISYWHKVRVDPTAGATTEVSALLTYLIGALAHSGTYWVAVALGVVAVLLLELREVLQRLTARVAPGEVLAFTKFLLLAIVVLPVLPDEPLTRFAIDPFRTWLVVVGVSGLSYAGYAAQRWLKQRGGVLLTALLGGAYSSTATTVVLARRARGGHAPRLYAGSTLAASGVMYLRVIALVLLFNPSLAAVLAPGLGAVALAGVATGVALALSPGRVAVGAADDDRPAKNPLELRSALVFGAAFLAVLVLTKLVVAHAGRGALYGLSAIVGLSDVDPFVLGAAQPGAVDESPRVAAAAIVIATAANNVAKAVYARVFGDRTNGRLAGALLCALAAAGLLPLAWLLGSAR